MSDNIGEEIKVSRIWDKLPQETPKAYQAFVMYLQLAPYGEGEQRRSLANVATALGLAGSSGVEAWSAKYNWVERATAYDSMSAHSTLTVRDTALKDFQQNIVTTMSMQLVAIDRVIDTTLQTMLKLQENGTTVETINIKRLVEAMEKKDTLARRLAGMPTTYTSAVAESEPDEETVYVIGA